MTSNAANAEYLLTQKTAEEYREMGYEVEIAPVLDFFPGVRPDLLARKGEDVRVVEVRTRSSLAANPKTIELAKAIQAMPGWSLDLVLVPEPERLDSPEGARTLEAGSVAQRIKDAEKTLAAGMPEAAFLLAWSACEAALRNLVAGLGADVSNTTSAGQVLDHAVFLGVLSRDEYAKLNALGKGRDAIVHGLAPMEFDAALVTELLDLARRMAADASSDDVQADDALADLEAPA